MTGRKDGGQLLENAKFKHLSETMLVSYREKKLDKIQRAIAESHLKDCVICPRHLAFLNREAENAANYVLTDEDQAANEKFVRELKPKKRFTDSIKAGFEELVSLVKDGEDAWNLFFSRTATRGANDGDELWHYPKKHGAFSISVILEKNASLTVHISSPKLIWERARLRFKLPTFSKEVTLEREGDRVAAKIKIPRAKRPRKMNKLSIEVLPGISGNTKK